MEIIIVLVFAFMSKKDAYGLIKNAVIMGEKGTLKKKKIFCLRIL